MSSTSLKNRIQEDLITLIKEKKSKETTVLRSLISEIKQAEIDQNKRAGLMNSQIIAVIEKMIKQRRQAIELFLQGGRQDLVDKEHFEIKLLTCYLPKPLSQAEIDQFIQDAIQKAQATVPADMGKVIAILKPQLQGRADMGTVSQQVKEALSK